MLSVRTAAPMLYTQEQSVAYAPLQHHLLQAACCCCESKNMIIRLTAML